MDKKDNMPIWRKVLIAICSLLIIACLILVGNIKSIITNEESERNTLTAVFEANKILRPFLESYELSEQEYEEFIKVNKALISKHGYDPKYIHELYNNKRFIDVFGSDVFHSIIKEYGENSYEYRCKMLHNKVVSDAFNYFYSPFNPNGTRDNRKGLGTDWEEYNHMSIPAKENYIRSDFQHKYEIIVEKEKKQRKTLESILFMIIIASGLGIFFLVSARIGKQNSHARCLTIYSIVCVALNIIIYGVMAIININSDETLSFVLIDFLPSTVVLSVTERFLAKKSYQDYQSYYLIPKWLSDSFNLTNEFRKRLLMIFLIYPFFFVVPLPVIGMFFLVFYILPVLLILGIIWIVLWVREGKMMDSKPQVQNDKARLYCRHCGKLIDADSDYCRYCGKKL
jgi:hypothetical protein